MKKLFTFFVAILFAVSMMATELYSIDFKQGQGNWTIQNVELGGLEFVWEQTTQYGMKATGYVGSNHATEAWLISPTFNLTDAGYATLAFSHTRRYGSNDLLSVLVRAGEGEWSVLEISAWPAGTSWAFIDATADLTEFVGLANVQVAFRYTSTLEGCATWEIKTLTITTEAASDQTPVSGKYKIGDLYYNLDAAKMTAEVTREGNNYAGLTTVIIPSSVIYNSVIYSVTSIGHYAFQNCSRLTSVTIPNSVTSIGYFAFYNCSSLNSVTIPNSVTSIGHRAFCGCAGLTSVTIPNSVTTIGESAFYGCAGLTSVTISNNVTSIGACVFAGCTGLSSPIYNAHVFAFMPVTYTGAYTIPNGIKCIAGGFYQCRGLTSVVIPNTVTEIGEWSFKECTGLTSVTIPNSVTNIGNEAFEDCSSLTSVTFESRTPISLCGTWEWEGETYSYCNDLGFDNDGLKIYVPCGSLEAYKIAEGWSQYASKMKYAPYPSYSITKIAENGYISTTSTDFTLCDEPLVTCIAQPNSGCYFARWSDGNTDNPRTIELTQDTTMEAIFDYLLTGKCGKDSVLTWTFDPSTMSLEITGKGALSENYTYGKFIELLTISNEVTIIGQSAFSACNNLKNVIIGSSVKVLEFGAFYGCSSIKTITCYSQRPPTVSDYALYGLNYSTIVYVPADYLETYKMHDTWGLYDVRPIETHEAIDEVAGKNAKSTNKLLRDGQLFILRGEKVYTLQGQEVK